MTNNNNLLIRLIDFDGTLFETEPLYDDCMDVLLQPQESHNYPGPVL